jgi:hypothetical protein
LLFFRRCYMYHRKSKRQKLIVFFDDKHQASLKVTQHIHYILMTSFADRKFRMDLKGFKVEITFTLIWSSVVAANDQFVQFGHRTSQMCSFSVSRTNGSAVAAFRHTIWQRALYPQTTDVRVVAFWSSHFTDLLFDAVHRQIPISLRLIELEFYTHVFLRKEPFQLIFLDNIFDSSRSTLRILLSSPLIS